jgi:hypothetical protein
VLKSKSLPSVWAGVAWCCATAGGAFSQEIVGMKVVGELKIPSYQIFESDPASRPPSWSGDGLITFEHNKSLTPVIHVFDASGVDSPIVLNIDRADMVYLKHAVRGADGTVAVGGRAYSSKYKGTGWNPDGFYTGFISWITPDHQSTTTIRLPSFYSPALVALAPDGTVWTKGWEASHIEGYGAVLDAPIMRHFDRTGKMIGSALLPKFLSPSSKLTYTDDFGYMVSSATRIGWMQNNSSYYEFSFDGQDVVEYPPLPIPPKVSILLGLALLDDGKVFASTSVFTGSEMHRGIYLYALDKSRKEWRQIDALRILGSADPKSCVLSSNCSNYLVGGSGNRLILKSDDPTIQKIVHVE